MTFMRPLSPSFLSLKSCHLPEECLQAAFPHAPPTLRRPPRVGEEAAGSGLRWEEWKDYRNPLPLALDTVLSCPFGTWRGKCATAVTGKCVCFHLELHQGEGAPNAGRSTPWARRERECAQEECDLTRVSSWNPREADLMSCFKRYLRSAC